jgi:hypothetical protein
MEHCWYLYYDKLRFEEKGHTGCKTFEINLLNIVQKLVYNDDYGGCIFQLCLNLNLGVPHIKAWWHGYTGNVAKCGDEVPQADLTYLTLHVSAAFSFQGFQKNLYILDIVLLIIFLMCLFNPHCRIFLVWWRNFTTFLVDMTLSLQLVMLQWYVATFIFLQSCFV